MAGLNTEESPLQDSINPEDLQDQKKRAWSLLRKAIKLNLSITETALWGTITVLRRVRALKRDMVETLIKDYGYNEHSAEEILRYASNNLWRDS